MNNYWKKDRSFEYEWNLAFYSLNLQFQLSDSVDKSDDHKHLSFGKIDSHSFLTVFLHKYFEMYHFMSMKDLNHSIP
jgi:hypothetical protein